MKWDKYTVLSQEAFQLAQQNALGLGHQEIKPEHLLFAFLEQEENIVNSILAKILSWRPLCVFSIVTLSLYLFHPLVLELIRKVSDYFLGYKISGLLFFFMTLFVSYFVACLTYTYIERPFVGTHK